MVILDEIAGHLAMKFNVGTQAVHSLPMPAGQLNRFGQLVVIEYVAGVDKEAGIELEHSRIYLETAAGNVLIGISLTR